jgi:hypothetical protein
MAYLAYDDGFRQGLNSSYGSYGVVTILRNSLT